MTREEAKELKLFQIVKYNVNKNDIQYDHDHKWLIPFCGMLGFVTQKIIWKKGGEEIHLEFPLKTQYDVYSMYDNIEELLSDFEKGHCFDFNVGFDISADEIDLINY